VRELTASAIPTDSGPKPALEPARHEALLDSIARRLDDSGVEPGEAALLCPGQVRSLVRAVTQRRFPRLLVLSSQELPVEARIRTIGEIELPD
jgi:flagellar biosynthesis component FlhA